MSEYRSRKYRSGLIVFSQFCSEVVQLGPTLREGEIAIGVCHIFASFNDTCKLSLEHQACFVFFTVSQNSYLGGLYINILRNFRYTSLSRVYAYETVLFVLF